MAESCIPRQIHNSAQISEVTCAPLSDVIIVGTPKRAKLKNSALEQSLLLVAERGIAPNHLIDLSMIVNICVKPLENGSGPTISLSSIYMYMGKTSLKNRNLLSF